MAGANANGDGAAWGAACERMAATLTTTGTPDWRELAIELAKVAELSAGNTLLLTGRVPEKRARSAYELGVCIARNAALAAEKAARRVLEQSASSTTSMDGGTP